MSDESLDDSLEVRLSRIRTLWTLVGDAHHGQTAAALNAQRQLLERYQGAIRRYLLAAVHNSDAAEDLYQEFALRFLHGDFRNVDPQRGRFRDYVKTVLYHLIVGHHKQQGRRPVSLGTGMPEPSVEPEEVGTRDAAFLTGWRDELLAQAWQGLEEAQQAGGQPYYTILRFRAENPNLSSTELAEQLTALLTKSMSAQAVRQAVHRARERFADLLVECVAHSLGDVTVESLRDELIDLGLLEYCRPALERRASEE
jgi:RNA polymerase sigma factor (sigma-70 family)